MRRRILGRQAIAASSLAVIVMATGLSLGGARAVAAHGDAFRVDVSREEPYAALTWQRWSDGCSMVADSGDVDTWIWRTEWKWDFREACQHHDLCYMNQDSERVQCDKEFRKAMERSCERMHTTIFGQYRCELVASVYYQAVRCFGGQAWADRDATGGPIVRAWQAGDELGVLLELAAELGLKCISAFAEGWSYIALPRAVKSEILNTMPPNPDDLARSGRNIDPEELTDSLIITPDRRVSHVTADGKRRLVRDVERIRRMTELLGYPIPVTFRQAESIPLE